MDDKGLRDVERWKDKIEVRLDNRQVAFLFFGSALVACLLFILGVIVGKRIESRGHAVAPEIEDPLALLDRVAATERPALEAPKVAAASRIKDGQGGTKATGLASKKVVAVAAAPAPTAPAVAAVAPSVQPVAAPTARPAVEKAARPPAQAQSEVAKPAGTTLASVSPVDGAGANKGAALPSSAAVANAPAPAGAAGAPKSKGHYTLQVRAFLNRAEADDFARRLLGQGSYVVPAEIPGHGTW
jgi:hypothetical protein